MTLLDVVGPQNTTIGQHELNENPHLPAQLSKRPTVIFQRPIERALSVDEYGYGGRWNNQTPCKSTVRVHEIEIERGEEERSCQIEKQVRSYLFVTWS